MATTKNGELFKVSTFIPSAYLEDADSTATMLRDMDEGIPTSLTPEDFLGALRAHEESAVYGFMLYARKTIAKYYWISYAHKATNYNKSEYYDEDKYLEWLTEIWVVLAGKTDWNFLDNFKYDATKPLGKQLAYWLTFTLQSIGRNHTAEELKAKGYEWTSSEKKRTSKDSGWVRRATEVSYNSVNDADDASKMYSRTIDGQVNDALEQKYGSNYASPEYQTAIDGLIDELKVMIDNGELNYVNGNEQANPDRVPLKDFLACIIDPETPDAVLSTVNDLAKYLNVGYNVVRTYKWKLGQLFQDYDIDTSAFMDIVKYDPDKVLAALGYKVAA